MFSILKHSFYFDNIRHTQITQWIFYAQNANKYRLSDVPSAIVFLCAVWAAECGGKGRIMDNKQDQEPKLSPLLAPFVPAATMAAIRFIEENEPFEIFDFFTSFLAYYVLAFCLSVVGAVVGGMVTGELDKIHNRTIRTVISVAVFVVSSLIAGYAIYWFLGKYLQMRHS